MKRATPRAQRTSSTPQDKYFLRDLHQEIDFYDRKLAYLNNTEEFATPDDRAEAEKRLLSKRAPLERTAKALAASGVEFSDKELPRSFRTTESASANQSRSR